MAWTETDTSTLAGSGSSHKYSQGAVLTPASNIITPSDPLHHVAAGTFHTIATTNIDTNLVNELVLVADGAITIATGGNISGQTGRLATNDTIKFALDGSTWREVSANAAQAIYNVRTYGATGDGATNDTTAVQAAATAALATGGRLRFPRGTCLL